MMDGIFTKLLAGRSLTQRESYRVFESIMSGGLSPVKTAAFLALLKAKKESPAEIAGAARLLRDRAVKVRVRLKDLADTCGTGGDGAHTFNISTAAALLGSCCGVPVAKHGNRAVSSRCGSADVMEAFGYNIQLSPEKTSGIMRRHGFAFFFAPLYHAAMKNVREVRTDLGFRTVFNLIGPLANPAGTKLQIMGVADSSLLETMPRVFRALGLRGYIFCGEEGVDEVTLTGRTRLIEVTRTGFTATDLHPRMLGLPKCRLADLAGGGARENAALLRGIFRGKTKGPARNVVVVNAAVLLKAAGRVKTFREGVARAADVLDSGRVYELLQRVVEASQT